MLKEDIEIKNIFKKRKLKYIGHIMRKQKRFGLLQLILHRKVLGQRIYGIRRISWLKHLAANGNYQYIIRNPVKKSRQYLDYWHCFSSSVQKVSGSDIRTSRAFGEKNSWFKTCVQIQINICHIKKYEGIKYHIL